MHTEFNATRDNDEAKQGVKREWNNNFLKVQFDLTSSLFHILIMPIAQKYKKALDMLTLSLGDDNIILRLKESDESHLLWISFFIICFYFLMERVETEINNSFRWNYSKNTSTGFFSWDFMSRVEIRWTWVIFTKKNFLLNNVKIEFILERLLMYGPIKFQLETSQL